MAAFARFGSLHRDPLRVGKSGEWTDFFKVLCLIRKWRVGQIEVLCVGGGVLGFRVWSWLLGACGAGDDSIGSGRELTFAFFAF